MSPYTRYIEPYTITVGFKTQEKYSGSTGHTEQTSFLCVLKASPFFFQTPAAHRTGQRDHRPQHDRTLPAEPLCINRGTVSGQRAANIGAGI